MIRSQARRNLIARQSGEHCHNYAQVLIGWRGEMDCEFQNGGRRLGYGNAAVVPGDAEHLFSGLGDESELLVIDLAPLDPYIAALEQACNLSFSETLFSHPGFITLNPQVTPLLDFAASQLRNQGSNDNPQLNCQLVSLFMTQFGQMYGSQQPLPPARQRLNLERLNGFIDQRLAEPPGNAELASVMHLSESHLYYLCQHALGKTPQQYVMDRRMHRARTLLTDTRLGLAVIATELGFADASSFSRAYKRYFAETPGQSRRLLKG